MNCLFIPLRSWAAKKIYRGKVIIIKEIEATNSFSQEGYIAGVITAYGKSLYVEEYDFF